MNVHLFSKIKPLWWLSVKIWWCLRKTVELIIFIGIQDINYLMADFNPQERVKKMVAAIKNEVHNVDRYIIGQREVWEHYGQRLTAIQDWEEQIDQSAEGEDYRRIQEANRSLHHPEENVYINLYGSQRSSLINESRLSKMQVRYE